MAVPLGRQSEQLGNAPRSGSARPDNRIVRLILVLTLAAVPLYAYLQWSAPYRVAEAFVRAVEQHDATRVVALSYPADSTTGLTPPAVELALNRVFPAPIRTDGDLVPSADAPGGGWRGPAQRTSLMEGTICRWHVTWADARTGRPLSALGPEGRLTSDIFVKPSNRGWRVLAGQFLWDTCLSRWGVGPGGRHAFASIAAQVGITGRIDTEGRLRLPDGSRVLSPEAMAGPSQTSH